MKINTAKVLGIRVLLDRATALRTIQTNCFKEIRYVHDGMVYRFILRPDGSVLDVSM